MIVTRAIPDNYFIDTINPYYNEKNVVSKENRKKQREILCICA